MASHTACRVLLWKLYLLVCSEIEFWTINNCHKMEFWHSFFVPTHPHHYQKDT